MKSSLVGLALVLSAAIARAGGVNWIDEDFEKAAAEARENGRLLHVSFRLT